MTAEKINQMKAPFLNNGNFWSDLGDMFGFGSQRRQQEFNSAEAFEQRSFNSEEAEKQRLWEEQMANTAHQREVADLQAAGLNPVLSTNLSGSAVPTGAYASGSNANTSGAVNSAGALSSIINAMTGYMAVKNYKRMGNFNSAGGIKNLIIKIPKL